MTWFNLWSCKRLTKRIWRYEKNLADNQKFVGIVRQWIKQDKIMLDRVLKKLSTEENLKYGNQMGFIDDADYQIMKIVSDVTMPSVKPMVGIRELTGKKTKVKKHGK